MQVRPAIARSMITGRKSGLREFGWGKDYSLSFDSNGGTAVSSLTPRATICSAPSGSGRCSFRASSGGAVIQASTSSGVVRITGIAFGWMAPTSAVRLRRDERVDVVGGLAFLNLADRR